MIAFAGGGGTVERFEPGRRGIDAVICGVGGDGRRGDGERGDTSTIVPYYRALTEFLSERW